MAGVSIQKNERSPTLFEPQCRRRRAPGPNVQDVGGATPEESRLLLVAYASDLIAQVENVEWSERI